MANNRELSQFGSFVTVDEGANNSVGIATTVRISGGGGLYVGGTEVIGPTGAWRGPNSGLIGAQGADGAQGAAGAQGTAGAQGSPGSTGAQGQTGNTGAQGAAGAQGQTGNTGAQGAAGAQGAPGSGVAAGSNTQIQFNDSGSFAGDAGFTFNPSTNKLIMGDQHQINLGKFTIAQRDALTGISSGAVIYNADHGIGQIYDGTTWRSLSSIPPTWNTASGSIATIYDGSRSAYSISNLDATANGGATISSYTVSSGSLPSGMSLNSNGSFSGTPNSVGSDTTSNFDVIVEDDQGGTATRSFSITIKAPITTNFSYTGSTATWTRPSGVTRVSFQIWGGSGGSGGCSGGTTGHGGKTSGTITNITGNLYIQVGQGGQVGSTSNRGWPNGGHGNWEHGCKGGGGGGSTNIYNESGTGSASNIIAVAGGGGGVSHNNPSQSAGNGGGTNGGNGRSAAGGSQNSGGYASQTPCGNGGNAGTQLQGGNAGTGSGCTNSGAGGGGGWYGGGAGGNSNSGDSYGSAGGGSGYFNTSRVTGGSTVQQGGSGWSDNKPSDVADGVSGDNTAGENGYCIFTY